MLQGTSFPATDCGAWIRRKSCTWRLGRIAAKGERRWECKAWIAIGLVDDCQKHWEPVKPSHAGSASCWWAIQVWNVYVVLLDDAGGGEVSCGVTWSTLAWEVVVRLSFTSVAGENEFLVCGRLWERARRWFPVMFAAYRHLWLDCVFSRGNRYAPHVSFSEVGEMVGRWFLVTCPDGGAWILFVGTTMSGLREVMLETFCWISWSTIARSAELVWAVYGDKCGFIRILSRRQYESFSRWMKTVIEALSSLERSRWAIAFLNWTVRR